MPLQHIYKHLHNVINTSTVLTPTIIYIPPIINTQFNNFNHSFIKLKPYLNSNHHIHHTKQYIITYPTLAYQKGTLSMYLPFLTTIVLTDKWCPLFVSDIAVLCEFSSLVRLDVAGSLKYAAKHSGPLPKYNSTVPWEHIFDRRNFPCLKELDASRCGWLNVDFVEQKLSTLEDDYRVCLQRLNITDSLMGNGVLFELPLIQSFGRKHVRPLITCSKSYVDKFWNADSHNRTQIQYVHGRGACTFGCAIVRLLD